jgi:hypothetical protein
MQATTTADFQSLRITVKDVPVSCQQQRFGQTDTPEVFYCF